MKAKMLISIAALSLCFIFPLSLMAREKNNSSAPSASRQKQAQSRSAQQTAPTPPPPASKGTQSAKGSESKNNRVAARETKQTARTARTKQTAPSSAKSSPSQRKSDPPKGSQNQGASASQQVRTIPPPATSNRAERSRTPSETVKTPSTRTERGDQGQNAPRTESSRGSSGYTGRTPSERQNPRIETGNSFLRGQHRAGDNPKQNQQAALRDRQDKTIRPAPAAVERDASPQKRKETFLKNNTPERFDKSRGPHPSSVHDNRGGNDRHGGPGHSGPHHPGWNTPHFSHGHGGPPHRYHYVHHHHYFHPYPWPTYFFPSNCHYSWRISFGSSFYVYRYRHVRPVVFVYGYTDYVSYYYSDSPVYVYEEPVVRTVVVERPVVVSPSVRVVRQRELYSDDHEKLISQVMIGTVTQRIAAAEDLAGYNSIATLAVLSDALINDADPDVRRAAAFSLGEIGEAISYEILCRSAQAEINEDVRAESSSAVGKLEGLYSQAELARAANYPPMNQGKIELGQYLEQLRLGTDKERREAAEKLDDHEGTQAVAAIINVLVNDPDAKVRENAAETLGKIGDPLALSFLQAAKQSDPDHDVREEAEESITKIKKYLL